MFNDKVVVHTPGYNVHDLSFDSLVSANFGELKVVLNKHLFAGETFEVSLEHLLKFQPLYAPAFQKYSIRFDGFLVPENIQWKDALLFYKGGKYGNSDLPRPSINPWYLYLIVALHSMYVRNISPNVLNPFSGTLIDDFNLPTFDYDLAKIEQYDDATLVSFAKSELDMPATLATSDLDVIISKEFESNTMDRSLPFVVPGQSRRINIVRNLFLCRLFNRRADSDSPELSVLYRLHSLNKDIDLVPFASYQAVWREFYRNQFVDDDGSQYPSLLTSPYLPDDLDLSELSLYITDSIDNINEPLFNSDWFDTSEEPYSQDWFSFGAELWMYFNRRNHIDEHYWSFNDLPDVLNVWQNTVGSRDVNFTKDYFTSASLTAMGESQVYIPVGSGTLFSPNSSASAATVGVPAGGGSPYAGSSNQKVVLSDTALGTIPELRIANVMQQLTEKVMLAGSRDYEWYQYIFGHRPSDSRLHRPDFLGRFKSTASISEVVQTSETTDGKPLGDVAGRANSYNGGYMFEVMADEPSWLMICMSIVPRQSYFQGLPREMCKSDRFDYLIPDFEQVGMQAIDKSELFLDTTQYDFEGAFGYTDKYNEYRSSMDEVHGEFRNSQLFWTSNRMFNNYPGLNPSFIRCNSADCDLYRPFAVTDGYTSHIGGQIHFNIKANRPLNLYPHYAL